MSIYCLNGEGLALEGREWSLDRDDPSLNNEKAGSLVNAFSVRGQELLDWFLGRYGLEYIVTLTSERRVPFRVITHPYETNTCFEKAELLGAWDPLNVIKALYFERSDTGVLYGLVIPETGCFVDRMRLKELLDLPDGQFLKKSEVLPRNMSFGTCSPFIVPEDLLSHGGRVAKLIFDSESIQDKREEGCLDDFSFGEDHRMSLQMNYALCFDLLGQMYPGVVLQEEVLSLSFKEKLVRSNGKVNISYQFNSLNYRTAKFMNSIHGYGDVTQINDYSDEINLPRILNWDT